MLHSSRFHDADKTVLERTQDLPTSVHHAAMDSADLSLSYPVRERNGTFVPREAEQAWSEEKRSESSWGGQDFG